MSQDPKNDLPKNDLPKALLDDLLPTHGEAIDPHEMARRDQRKRAPVAEAPPQCCPCCTY